MSGGGYRLTSLADEDITDILRESARLFGAAQRSRYAGLLEKAARLVTDDPDRPGSRDRGDLVAGVRSFHVELAARRRGAASHILYYMQEDPHGGRSGVVIVRVLHERMDPTLHLAAVLD